MEIVDQSAERGAFLLECSKCLRSYEIHGHQERLELALEAEGWREDGGRNVCPRCPVHRELPTYNKTRENARNYYAALRFPRGGKIGDGLGLKQVPR